MTYTVLARKYRPQTFADVIGQGHIVRTLENSIRLNRVAHAYLFCGPRGVGKTTAARLFARALNCEKGPTSEPCGTCRACTEIRDGNSVDVTEIDGASNNGVDNVREIREAAQYMPQRDRNKIYIIDEVHMLSGAAFNALLKTLEEPPGHVKFIFATTEVHKLPDTIVSRCQRHNFRRITAATMADRLRTICQQESITISDSALRLVSKTAEGGMRDALSLLDQVISASGNTVSDEQVTEALGTIDPTLVSGLSAAVLERNTGRALEVIEELWTRGHDLKRVCEELALELRDVVVAKSLGGKNAQALPESVRNVDIAQAVRAFDILHAAVWDIARASQPQAACQVAVLKAIHLAPAGQLSDLIQTVASLSSGTAPVKSAGAPGGRSAPGPFRA